MAFLPPSPWTQSKLYLRKKSGLCASTERRRAFCVTGSETEEISNSAVRKKHAKAPPTVSPEKSSAFHSWALSEKVRYPHLEVSNFDSLRGMRATTPLVRNAPIMSVPSSAALQTSTVEVRSPMPNDVCDDSWKKLPWFARLALKLQTRKQALEWRGWIDMLPKFFDTPLHWTELDLAELQNPRLAQVIYRQRKNYRKLYGDIAADSRNEICPTMTYDDFLWAVECVRSRSFAGPLGAAPFKSRFRLILFAAFNTFTWPSLHFLDWDKAVNGGLTAILALVLYDLLYPKIMKSVQNIELKRYALAPGIDFLNHCSDLSSAATVDYEYFLDRFVVRAREDYDPGTQVYISYGSQSNDSLLQFYGFVEDDNPYDDYVFSSHAEELLKVRPGTLRVLRNGKFSDAALKQISESFEGGEGGMAQALAELCRLELDGLKTTLEEDEHLLQSCDVNSHRGLAIRYRIGKKRILKEAQKVYEQAMW